MKQPSNSSTYNDDVFSGVLQLSDGFLFVGDTYTWGAGYSDGWVVKTDTNGNVIWSKAYSGYDYEWFRGIVPVSDGYLILSFRGEIVKLDSNFNLVWIKKYNRIDGMSMDFRRLLPLSDGWLVFGGYIISIPSYGEHWKPFILKLDQNFNPLTPLVVVSDVDVSTWSVDDVTSQVQVTNIAPAEIEVTDVTDKVVVTDISNVPIWIPG